MIRAINTFTFSARSVIARFCENSNQIKKSQKGVDSAKNQQYDMGTIKQENKLQPEMTAERNHNLIFKKIEKVLTIVNNDDTIKTMKSARAKILKLFSNSKI